jgi:hypothetical protein
MGCERCQGMKKSKLCDMFGAYRVFEHEIDMLVNHPEEMALPPKSPEDLIRKIRENQKDLYEALNEVDEIYGSK